MNKKLLVAVAMACAPLAAAEAMDVATFLGKADALEKKGLTAMFSSDFKLLKKEVQGASEQLRAERLAAERSGRRGAYCPPKSARLDSKELLAHFRAVPPAQRPRMQVKDGLRTLLARKYPCRG